MLSQRKFCKIFLGNFNSCEFQVTEFVASNKNWPSMTKVSPPTITGVGIGVVVAGGVVTPIKYKPFQPNKTFQKKNHLCITWCVLYTFYPHCIYMYNYFRFEKFPLANCDGVANFSTSHYCINFSTSCLRSG